MANVVEIVVRTKDDASKGLKQVEVSAKSAGTAAGKGFSSNFGKSANLGGVLGNLFGNALESRMKDEGDKAGKGFLAGLAGRLKSANFGGGSSGSFLDKGVLGGALPGIMGIGAGKASLLGLGAALLGGLPTAAAGAGALGMAGVGGEVIKLGATQLIGSKNTKADPNAEGPLYNQAQAIAKTFQSTMQNAAGGMLKPLKQAMGQIPGILKELAPELKDLFSAAGTMIQPLLNGITHLAGAALPLLSQALRAAAPLITPLLSGFSNLVTSILPALTTLLKAAAPAMDAVFNVISDLGAGIGNMLTSFAPVLKSSAVIFNALGDVVAAIFPILGKLAAMMATALAPVFTQLAGIVEDLLPVFTVLGGVVAQFAGAVLTDLVGVLGSVAQLFKDISPSLKTLAQALGQVFNTLENSGFFAILADAIEQLVPVLAQFINQLVKNLAPFLPTLIGLLGKFAGILTNLLAAGLGVVLGLLTKLMQHFPKLVPALAAVTAGWMALNAVMALNPFTAAIAAVLLVIGALDMAWKHSQTFRNVVTTAFADVGKVVLTFAEIFLTEMQTVSNIFMDVVGAIIHGAAAAFGWVPGVGPKLRDAASKFDSFHKSVNDGFNKAHAKIEAWKRDLDNMPKIVKIKGDINDLTSKLNNAKRQLRDPNLTKTRRAAIQANINDLTNKIAQAKGELNRLNGTTAYTRIITTKYVQTGGTYDFPIVKGIRRAAGGAIGAAVGGARSGLVEVGEHGRELVRLPGGSSVITNPDTERMLAGGSGAGVVQLEIVGGGSKFEQFMAEFIRNFVRVNGGGDVQRAFGRN